ncbi:MAG: hypothetical protein WC389_05470 [Lutibacter sp.]|jgi:glutaminase
MRYHSKIYRYILNAKLNNSFKKLALSDIDIMETYEHYAKQVCFNKRTKQLSMAFVWSQTNFGKKFWTVIFDKIIDNEVKTDISNNL